MSEASRRAAEIVDEWVTRGWIRIDPGHRHALIGDIDTAIARAVASRDTEIARLRRIYQEFTDEVLAEAYPDGLRAGKDHDQIIHRLKTLKEWAVEGERAKYADFLNDIIADDAHAGYVERAIALTARRREGDVSEPLTEIRRALERGEDVSIADTRILLKALEHAERAKDEALKLWRDGCSERGALAKDYEALGTRLVEAEAKYEHDRGLFAQIVDDLFDGMECDASCDDYSHGETCPTTLGPEAVKRLRAQLTAAEQRGRALNQAAIYHNAVTGWSICKFCQAQWKPGDPIEREQHRPTCVLAALTPRARSAPPPGSKP